MPRQSDGKFVRDIGGGFTGPMAFQDQAADTGPNGQRIFADQQDNAENDMAQAVEDNLDTLGRNAMQADLNFATFKATGSGFQNSEITPTDRSTARSLADQATLAQGTNDTSDPDFGGNFDAIKNSDGAITSGTANFTSNNASFTSSDVGKLFNIKGAGASGATLATTIQSFVSPNAVTVADNASTTVTNASYVYGSDNTAAIQAAHDKFEAEGAPIFYPPGRGMIAAPIEFNIGAQFVGSGSQPDFTVSEIVAGKGLAGLPMFRPKTGNKDLHGVQFLNHRIDAFGVADHCIHFSQPLFQNNFLDRLYVTNAVKDNILADSGTATPIYWGQISTFTAGEAGIRLNENQAAFTIANVTGDNNGTALVHIDGPNIQGGYNIQSWKSERAGAGTEAGNPVVFKITTAQGGFLKIGPGRYFVKDDVTVAGTAIVQIDGAANNQFSFEIDAISRRVDSPAPDYAQLIENLMTGNTFTVPTSKSRAKIVAYKDPMRMHIAQANNFPAILFVGRESSGSVGGSINQGLRINHPDDGADRHRMSFFDTSSTEVTRIEDGSVAIRDSITAPAQVSGLAFLYVDSADGALKVKFGDGTVKTIATN